MAVSEHIDLRKLMPLAEEYGTPIVSTCSQPTSDSLSALTFAASCDPTFNLSGTKVVCSWQKSENNGEFWVIKASSGAR